MDEIKDTQDVPEKAPSEETSETTPVETETKTYSDEQLQKAINDALSAKGRDAKRLSDWETSLANQEKQLQQLQETIEKRNLEAKIEQRKKELEALADDPDGVQKARYKHQMEDELEAMEKRKRNLEGAVDRQYNQASELMEKYDLPPSAFRELMKATNPDHMIDKAKALASELKKPATPAPVKEHIPKPDSGISDVSGEDDDEFMKRYSEGKTDDHARARKILAKLK